MGALGVLAFSRSRCRPSAWAGLAYLSLVSMFLGFFAWYLGLPLGGVARVAMRG